MSDVKRSALQHPLLALFFLGLIALVVWLKIAEVGRQIYEATPEGRANAVRQEQEAQQQAKIRENQLDMELAQDFVKNKLRDPASAQFSGIRIAERNGKKSVCGYVNARNGFGGMSGNDAFAVYDYHVYLASEHREYAREVRALCG